MPITSKNLENYGKDGLHPVRVARATFDATGGKAIGTHYLGVTIPDNSVLVRAYYDVVTTFTSATDAGTIALACLADDDILAAVAISDGGNPYDAGLQEGIQDGTMANAVKLTSDKQLYVKVAVEALTAGKLVLFVEYVESL